MRRLRFFLVMAVLSMSAFLATNPVFAAAGGNGNGNGGVGNCNGNGNKCDPGTPVLPEAPVAIWLLGAGLAVIGLTCAILYLRRRGTRTMIAE